MRAVILSVALCLTLTANVFAQAPSATSSSPTVAAQPSTQASSTAVAVPEPTEKALSFYRSGNVLWVVDTLWGLLVPALFLFTGFSARIRVWARGLGKKWFFVIGLYFVIFSLITFVIDLPLSYYEGFVRGHTYGLSNKTFEKWASDEVKGLLVGIVGGVLFLWVPYLLLKKSPRRWWLYTGLLTVPFLFFVILIQPIWIDPLFNKFGPMKNKTIEASILELADRAGIEGSRVFEVAKSEDTKALNAYVTGFGNTKRIVLWDTIIAKLDEPELLVVMGHEMGHYALGHVWKTILFLSVLIMATLYAIHRTAGWLIDRYRGRFDFGDLSDVASFPLIILLFGVSSLIVAPLALAFERNIEHEADRFGLEITRSNHAAATAFVKLQQENLGVPRPGWVYKVWRASHPPLGERIDFSNEYRPWEKNEPLVYEHLFKRAEKPAS